MQRAKMPKFDPNLQTLVRTYLTQAANRKKSQRPLLTAIDKVLKVSKKQTSGDSSKTLASIGSIVCEIGDLESRIAVFILLLQMVVDSSITVEKLISERDFLRYELREFDGLKKRLETEKDGLLNRIHNRKEYRGIWPRVYRPEIRAHDKVLSQEWFGKSHLTDIAESIKKAIWILENGPSARATKDNLSEIDRRLISKDSWLLDSRITLELVITLLTQAGVKKQQAGRLLVKFLFASGLWNEQKEYDKIRRKWKHQGHSALSTHEVRSETLNKLTGTVLTTSKRHAKTLHKRNDEYENYLRDGEPRKQKKKR